MRQRAPVCAGLGSRRMRREMTPEVRRARRPCRTRHTPRQGPTTRRIHRKRDDCGSAASAAMARPSRPGDSDARKSGSVAPASRHVASVTPSLSSELSVQVARRYRHHRDAMRRELLGHRIRQTGAQRRGQIEEQARPVGQGRAVGDLDDQARDRRLGSQHQRHQVLQGDDVRPQRPIDGAAAARQRNLPERSAERDREVVAPEIQDQDVEPSLLAANALDERGHIAAAAWSTRTAMPRPPCAVTCSAVCSMVSGRPW